MKSQLPQTHRGFTLIELVVTMLIVAILGVIAVSMYKTSVLQSRRTDAKTALLDLAAREERNFSTANAYTVVPAQLGYVGAWPLAVGSGYYTVTVTSGSTTTFTATATAVGSQTADTPCLTFSIDQSGNQTATTTPGCW